MRTVAATGHRPPKAGLNFNHADPVDMEYVLRIRQHLLREEVELTIVGGALGWDTLFARASHQLGIPFDLYMPFEGMENAWPQYAQRRFHLMRRAARNVINVSESANYHRNKMQLRNEAMVDAGEEVWALWDGSPGGTRNCVTYAKIKRKPIVNFFEGEDLIR